MFAVAPPVIVTPLPPLPIALPFASKAVVPLTSVPMQLPTMTFWLVPSPLMFTPSVMLPEITLTAPDAEPPTVLSVAPLLMSTPSMALGRALAPVRSMPVDSEPRFHQGIDDQVGRAFRLILGYSPCRCHRSIHCYSVRPHC